MIKKWAEETMFDDKPENSHFIKLSQKYAEQMSVAQIEAEPLEAMIRGSAFSFYSFFLTNSFNISRADWSTRNKVDTALLSHAGWIYAFYGDDFEYPVYVGETNRTLKKRFDEHKKNPKCTWWNDWDVVTVMPCELQSHRKFFEAILGAAGGYRGNQQQPLFDQDFLVPLLLGLTDLKTRSNATRKKIQVPHSRIMDDIELIKTIYELALRKDWKNIVKLFRD